jgi:hypothetical protein
VIDAGDEADEAAEPSLSPVDGTVLEEGSREEDIGLDEDESGEDVAFDDDPTDDDDPGDEGVEVDDDDPSSE